MCNNIKAAAVDNLSDVRKVWLEKEVEKFRIILKLYGRCHSVFNSARELTCNEINNLSKLNGRKKISVLVRTRHVYNESIF